MFWQLGGKLRDWSFFITIFQSLSIVIAFDYFTDKFGHWFLNNDDIQDWCIPGIGHSAREHYIWTPRIYCFPGGAGGREPARQWGRGKRRRFNPWVRKIPGEGHGNPLQHSRLENRLDRGVWRATVRRVWKSQTRLKRLSASATVLDVIATYALEMTSASKETSVNLESRRSQRPCSAGVVRKASRALLSSSG